MRAVLKRKIKNVRAQLGTQIISVRSRVGNVLDMPSVSESRKDFKIIKPPVDLISLV